MAIGTPTIVGSVGVNATQSSLTLTTTGAIATHDLVVIFHYANATTGRLTVGVVPTDDSGNIYSQLYVPNTGSAPVVEIFACFDAIAMTSGHSILLPSFIVNPSRQGMYVINVTGMVNAVGCFDPHTTQFERSTSTGGTTTSILNSAAAQMLLLNCVSAGGTLGTFTPTSGFTALTALTSNAFMYPEYKIISNGAATTGSPSWVNSVLHSTMLPAFVGKPATNTSRQAQGTLTGVGV